MLLHRRRINGKRMLHRGREQDPLPMFLPLEEVEVTKKTTLVYLRWFDSAIYKGDECSPDEIDGYSEMESAGLLVSETKDSITIALDRSLKYRTIRLVLCVPKVNIRKIKRFKVPS